MWEGEREREGQRVRVIWSKGEEGLSSLSSVSMLSSSLLSADSDASGLMCMANTKTNTKLM